MLFTPLFLHPQTRLLRSGWRALLFVLVLSSPQWIFQALSVGQTEGGGFEISVSMIVFYTILVGWVLLVSWGCLRFLDQLGFRALGFAPHRGWGRDVGLGCGISLAMVCLVVVLQMLGGGTTLRFNDNWLSDGLGVAMQQTVMTTGLLVVAGAFEELLYRGYAFQTLTRSFPTVVPLAITSVLFGLGHWNNPSRTFFSTTNTVLAGIWLSVAYLKTRSLWFPTALHITWNLAMGVLFGLPVSGLTMTTHPLFRSTSEAPLWLTGGNYGCEGGGAATLVVLVAILILWRARWLSVSPEMNTALSHPLTPDDLPVALGLNQENEP